MTDQETAGIDREKYETDGDPQFRATFDYGVLQDMHAPFDIPLGTVRIVPTLDSLLIEAKNETNVASVAVEFESSVFDEWVLNSTGEINVDGSVYRGLMNIAKFADDVQVAEPVFEISLTEDGFSVQHTESSYGGKVPESATDPRLPNPVAFNDEMAASATIDMSHTIDMLSHEVDYESQDARAELAADHDCAHLTFSGSENSRFVELDDADHPDGESIRTLYHPEYITKAVNSFSHLSSEIQAYWGEEYPAVFVASTTYATHEAMVTPRIEGNDGEPLYETADNLETQLAYGGGD